MKEAPDGAGGLQSHLAHGVEAVAAVPGAALFTRLCVRKASGLSRLQDFPDWCLHVTAAVSHWSKWLHKVTGSNSREMWEAENVKCHKSHCSLTLGAAG